MLKGKLTYLLAGIAMAGAAAGWFLGWIDSATAANLFWQGAVVFGLRRAIG